MWFELIVVITFVAFFPPLPSLQLDGGCGLCSSWRTCLRMEEDERLTEKVGMDAPPATNGFGDCGGRGTIQ